MQFPSRVLDWLHQRGLTDQVISEAGLFWNDSRIAIPVKDKNGNILFHKYRRDPDITTGAKYSYSPGAKSALYNVQILNNRAFQHIYIAEGETDALLLTSKGFPAVSSTGGAGTFKEEWAGLFKNKIIYICYDLDEAGIKGAQKVASLFPASFIAVLPDMPVGKKDVTDYFMDHTADDFGRVIDKAAMITTWASNELPKTKTEIEKQVKIHKFQMQQLLEEERKINRGRKTRVSFDYLRQFYENQISNLRRKVSPVEKKKIGYNLELAKAVPMDDIFDGTLRNEAGNRARGLCLFHNDKGPSFVVYRNNNSWYCFGGCGGGDTIDFVMRRDNVDFKTAINILLK